MYVRYVSTYVERNGKRANERREEGWGGERQESESMGESDVRLKRREREKKRYFVRAQERERMTETRQASARQSVQERDRECLYVCIVSLSRATFLMYSCTQKVNQIQTQT